MLNHFTSMRFHAQIFGIIVLTVTTQTRAGSNDVKSIFTDEATVAGPALCTEFVGPDFNHDCYVDMDDYRLFQLCVTGPDLGPPSAGCAGMDLDEDGDVDELDFSSVPQCVSGPEYLAEATCEELDYTPPTSLDRINDELAAGLITELDALRYSVFDIFGDNRLPTRFYGASYEEGTHALQSLSEQYESLSPDEQAELLPFLLPPDAPGSWYQNQLQQTTVAGGEPEGDFAKVDVKDGSGASVAVIKWPVSQNYLSEATVVHDALSGAGGVWEKLTALMGRDPMSDSIIDTVYNGTDGRYDIYLMPLGGNTYGSCTGASPGFFQDLFNDNRRTSYIIMDITNITSDFPGARLAKKIRANLSHEFMHAIQFAFDSVDAFSDRIWLMDAVSTWAEHFVFTNDQMEQDDAPSYLKTLDRPMELNQGNRRYGVYLFFFHHVTKYGTNFIRTVFENTESMVSLMAVNNAVPGGYADNWAEFAVENWNDTSNPPIDGYEAADMLKKGAATYTNFRVPALAGSQDVIDLAMTGDGLKPLSAQYIWIKFSDQQIRSILFANGLTFDLDRGVPSIFNGAMGDETYHSTYLSDAETKDIHVMALIKQNGAWLPDPIDLTKTAFASFCQEASSESIEEIVFIMANARFESSERDPVKEKGLPSHMFISNMGCGAWEGTGENVYAVTEPDEVTTSTTTIQSIKFVRDTFTIEQIAAGSGQQLFGPPTVGTLVIPASVFTGLNPLAGGYQLESFAASWTHSSDYESGSSDCSESGGGTMQTSDAFAGATFVISPYLFDSLNNAIPSLYRSFFVSVAFVDNDENFFGQCTDNKGITTFHDSAFGAGLGGGYRNMDFGTLLVDPSGSRINQSWTIEENSYQINLQSKKIP